MIGMRSVFRRSPWSLRNFATNTKSTRLEAKDVKAKEKLAKKEAKAKAKEIDRLAGVKDNRVMNLESSLLITHAIQAKQRAIPFTAVRAFSKIPDKDGRREDSSKAAGPVAQPETEHTKKASDSHPVVNVLDPQWASEQYLKVVRNSKEALQGAAAHVSNLAHPSQEQKEYFVAETTRYRDKLLKTMDHSKGLMASVVADPSRITEKLSTVGEQLRKVDGGAALKDAMNRMGSSQSFPFKAFAALFGSGSFFWYWTGKGADSGATERNRVEASTNAVEEKVFQKYPMSQFAERSSCLAGEEKPVASDQADKHGVVMVAPALQVERNAPASRVVDSSALHIAELAEKETKEDWKSKVAGAAAELADKAATELVPQNSIESLILQTAASLVRPGDKPIEETDWKSKVAGVTAELADKVGEEYVEKKSLGSSLLQALASLVRPGDKPIEETDWKSKVAGVTAELADKVGKEHVDEKKIESLLFQAVASLVRPGDKPIEETDWKSKVAGVAAELADKVGKEHVDEKSLGSSLLQAAASLVRPGDKSIEETDWKSKVAGVTADLADKAASELVGEQTPGSLALHAAAAFLRAAVEVDPAAPPLDENHS